MKHTHSRKKMLLSSIAMLLVALVALGSATYAWFTANPNATAKGLSLKTTASAGLVVRTDSDLTWSHEAKLYNGGTGAFNLNPVSQDQSEPAKLYTTKAAASDKYDAAAGEMSSASGGTYTAPSSFSTGDYYYEKVYFRLSDGSNAAENAGKKVVLNGVTISKTASTSDITDAIRVSVVGPSGLVGTYALNKASANGTVKGTLKGAEEEEIEFSPELKTTAEVTETELGVTGLSATASDTTKSVTVYVYLDGQDEKCYSDKVTTIDATQLIDNISLSFELK